MRGFAHTTDLTLRRGSVRCFTNGLRSPDRRSITKSLEVFGIFQNLADSFAKRLVTEVEALLVRGDSGGASWTALERVSFVCGEIMGQMALPQQQSAVRHANRGVGTRAVNHHGYVRSPCFGSQSA
jgi:hypothetical protein